MRRGLFVIATFTLFAAGCQAGRGVRTSGGEWQTEAASIGELTATVGATGTVRSNQSGQLAFETSGIVEQVLVEIGEFVNEGAVLATLQESSLNAQVILAKADLASAERDLEQLLDTELAFL